jgi:uncharacterized membrane protein YbhN (UPF0104 family)
VPVAEKQLRGRSTRNVVRRAAVAVVSLGIVVATFVYFLPTIANYGDVVGVVKQLTWPWMAALLGATALYLAAFAPPWQA